MRDRACSAVRLASGIRRKSGSSLGWPPCLSSPSALSRSDSQHPARVLRQWRWAPSPSRSSSPRQARRRGTSGPGHRPPRRAGAVALRARRLPDRSHRRHRGRLVRSLVEIEFLAVAEPWRGRGIASALLREAGETARAAGTYPAFAKIRTGAFPTMPGTVLRRHTSQGKTMLVAEHNA
ncbi:GNAT family N-acetyltransferase [Streptomyces sp. NPDC008092]|uniref:GNAT family N-acetyltransferase n=1 Tax=Streptomyces sp. NPDC008092 TaxID=3364808 RepID=UPI0036E9AAA2